MRSFSKAKKRQREQKNYEQGEGLYQMGASADDIVDADSMITTIKRA